jgi:hypothetical protein
MKTKLIPNREDPAREDFLLWTSPVYIQAHLSNGRSFLFDLIAVSECTPVPYVRIPGFNSAWNKN